MGEYLSLSDAARYLGCSRVKITQLVKDGVLPYTVNALDKRAKLVSKDDLDKLKTAPAATELKAS